MNNSEKIDKIVEMLDRIVNVTDRLADMILKLQNERR